MTQPLPRPPSRRLPRRFHAWLAATTLGAAGDAMLTFALIWLSSGYGPVAVAFTTTAAVLPRAALMLLGGVLGDRHGPRRILTATHVVLLALLLLLLVVVSGTGGDAALLAAAALGTGVVTAVQLPAAAVYPRLLLTEEDQLPRALAQATASLQVARILGVAVGGTLVATRPLEVVVGVDAVTVLLVLVVLGTTGPAADSGRVVVASRGRGLRADFLEGVATVTRLRVWRLLTSVALLCAAVLPTISVLVPLAARARGWSAGHAGGIDAAWAAGALIVTAVVALVGTSRQTEAVLATGPVAAGLGLAGLAVAPSPLPAAAAAALVGASTALFTTHVAPVLVRRAPPDQLTRFQALLGVVQVLPPALANAPYAALGAMSIPVALAVAASISVTAGVLQLGRGGVSDPDPDPAPRP